MATPARETLSLSELFSLFHKDGDPSRWLSMADSQEYLALISWLVQRANRGD